MLAVRIPRDIEKRLEQVAKRTGRSKTFLARMAILKHLEDLEDIHVAEQRLEALRRGEDNTVALDELLKAHGLAG
jgi:RHH-type transcriptional regulator, rel operon repressor / antitoxin RelB